MSELIFFVSFAVFFSFLCSLFEAALYSVPVGHIESLAKSGSASGRLLKKFRENVDAPLRVFYLLTQLRIRLELPLLERQQQKFWVSRGCRIFRRYLPW